MEPTYFAFRFGDCTPTPNQHLTRGSKIPRDVLVSLWNSLVKWLVWGQLFIPSWTFGGKCFVYVENHMEAQQQDNKDAKKATLLAFGRHFDHLNMVAYPLWKPLARMGVSRVKLGWGAWPPPKKLNCRVAAWNGWAEMGWVRSSHLSRRLDHPI